MIMNLWTTIGDANNESKINFAKMINACKKIYLPVSILQQSWSWHQLIQCFLGGWIPFGLLGQP